QGSQSQPQSQPQPQPQQRTVPANQQQIQQEVQRIKSGEVRLNSLSSRYTLCNAQVSWTVGEGRDQQTVTLASPLNDTNQMRDLLPKLLDKTTTQRGTLIPARVNVNTAPRAVLAALPEMTDADVQTILDRRPPVGGGETVDDVFSTPAWLLTDCNFPGSKMQTLERYVTARTSVYRVQSVGHFDQGGPTARVEAVIDTNGGKPRIVMMRDLTELGRGFDFQSE